MGTQTADDLALQECTHRFAESMRSVVGRFDGLHDETYEQFAGAIGRLVQCLGQLESRFAAQDGDVRPLQQLFRERLGRWFQQGPLNAWSLSKPLGYAGDFVIMDWIMDPHPAQWGLPALMDRYFLDLEAARAVATRRHWLARRIPELMAAHQGPGSFHIVSIGCGPAAEILDCLATMDGGVHLTLVDTEPEALAFIRRRIDESGSPVSATFRQENLYDYVRARETDLTGRYGRPADLLYSVGVMDYVPDRHVGRFLRMFRRTLTPGGRAWVGNFARANSSRVYMEWVLDWYLHHRDAAELLEFAGDEGPARVIEAGAPLNNLLEVGPPVTGGSYE